MKKGSKMSEASRIKIGEASRRMWESDGFKEKRLSFRQPDEAKLKIGRASRLMWANPDTKARISASMVKREKIRRESMSESDRAAILDILSKGREGAKAGCVLFHKQHPEHAERLQDSYKVYLSKPENTGENFHGALCWSIKSPEGKVFQFKNLIHFVRTNNHLFTEQQLRLTKKGTPVIAESLMELSPRRKKVINQVHGWTWHVNHESIDLLNREL